MTKSEMECKEDFLQQIIKELETFSLDEQNYIMKTIHQDTKERRMCELKELKIKDEMIDKAITELG